MMLLRIRRCGIQKLVAILGVFVLFTICNISVYVKFNQQSNMEEDSEIEAKSSFSGITSGKNSSPFIKVIESISWDTFKSAIETNDFITTADISNTLVDILTPYLLMEPRIPINESCIPPPLTILDKATCVVLTPSRKVGVLLQLGLDFDSLEIHLNELDDLVDAFFLVESSRVGFTNFDTKPLLWEAVEGQERFAKFASKIVHFVIEDKLIDENMNLVDSSEKLDEFQSHFKILIDRLGWELFNKWNEEYNFFEEDAIIGIGSVNEIPNRNSLHFLKSCQLDADPVDLGLWFPFGSINQAFQFDTSIDSHSYAYGNPTYWTLKTAKSQQLPHLPSRNGGKSDGYLLSGMYSANYGYLPYQIVQRLVTLSEQVHSDKLKLSHLYDNLQSYHVQEVERNYARVPERYVDSIIKLDRMDQDEVNDLVYLPWFYNCNRKRYPAWERQHDTRLDY